LRALNLTLIRKIQVPDINNPFLDIFADSFSMSLDLFEEYAVDCVQGLLAINLPAHCGRWNEAQILGGDYAEDHLLFEQFLTHFCIVRLIVVSGVIEALVGFPQHWHTSSDKNQGGCLPKLFRADEAGLIVLYHNVLT
jgi:hypothetical protein